MRGTFARAVVVTAAAVNMIAAVVLALQRSGRPGDLYTMYDWVRAWLIDGRSLYTIAGAATDYPPPAIVMLAPMALVPRAWIVPVWTIVGLAFAVLLPWVAIRSTPRSAQWPTSAAWLPVALMLCWACSRTLLQFSALSLTLALCAVRSADDRPLTAGVLLGLGLAKPHIAGPVALWALASSRLRMLLAASAVTAAGWLVYDARIGENPLSTLAGYLRVLRDQYGGQDGLVGRTSIRPWIHAMVPPGLADTAWLGAAACLAVLSLFLVWRRERRSGDSDGAILSVALLCVVSLLSVYHNSNNLILLMPAFAALWPLNGDARWRWIAIAALQGALTFDLSARLTPMVAGAWYGPLVANYDRLLVAGVFALLVALISLPGKAPADSVRS